MAKISLLGKLLLIACGVSAIVFIIGLIKWLPYPYQLEFGEGFHVYISRLFASGQFQWDISKQPYMVGIYGPVYFLIVGFIGQFANITLRLERGVSLVFLLISLFLMYKIATLVTKNKIIAVIVALLPLTHPVVRQWGYMGRSDSLALMFALSGIYIVIKYGDSRKLYLSAIPFALAFFTKQYYLAGAIAIPSVLIINKQVKAAFAYALVYLFAIGIGLGLGTMLVGASFFKELISYNQTMPLFGIFGVGDSNIAWAAFPLIGLGILAVFYVKEHKDYLSCWLVVVLCLFLFSAFRAGSGVNYGLETIFAVCLCGGLQLEKLIYKRWDMHVFYIALVIPIFFVVTPMQLPDSGYAARCQIVLNLIKDDTNPILTENAGIVLQAGHNPYLEPFVYTNLTKLGVWNDSQYLADLQSGYIQYVILNEPIETAQSDRFLPQVKSAIEQNYYIIYNAVGYGGFSFVVYKHN